MATETNRRGSRGADLRGTALGGLWIVLVAAAGAGALYAGLPRFRAARQARGWPKAPGRILSSRETSSVVPDSADMYSPQIRYEYVVDGRTYTGSRVSFAIDSSYSRSRVQATLQRYPAGQEVTVRYDPADPSRCCLQSGPWHGGLSRVATGAALCVTAAGLLVWRLRPRGEGRNGGDGLRRR
jgi:hypothetical protein